MGFKPDIDRILQRSSKRSRQTLLFSAIPSTVQQIAGNLRPGFEFIDTVGEDSEQTHLCINN